MRTSFFLTAFALTPLAAATPLRLPSPASGGVAPRQDEFGAPPFGDVPAGEPAFPDENASVPRAPAPQDSASQACDKSALQLPSSALAAPSGSLLMVAVGKGTQNYTCADSSSAPASIGAVAQLFDETCNLAANPSTATSALPAAAPAGSHFFRDNTTPEFDVASLGNTVLKKAQDADAPNPASDVKWLRLAAQAAGTTSKVKEIYRVQTVGGKAPATCAGKAAGDVITVDYEAQYWFYG